MGRNRRQQRVRQRRQERTTSGSAPGAASSNGAGAAPRRSSKPKPAWRHTIDQWGGLPMVGGGVVVLVVLGVLVWQNLPGGVPISDADLMGDEVPMTSATHIADESLMDIQPGLPPAGGPHFNQPMREGIYDDIVPDGHVVHSLEHGMIWFSYNPDLISEADREAMMAVAREYSNDVVVSPRPDNRSALFILSWGRRIEIEGSVDQDLLREFIQTNRNRSPEPGLRGGVTG